MLAESRVLKHLEKSARQSAGYKQLVRELSLRGSERRDLQELLDSLVRRGKLLETGRDRYTLAQSAANQNLLVGKLSMHRGGYGFVTPDIEELRRTIQGDIYISPMAIGPAM